MKQIQWDRFAGMASAVGIIFTVTLIAWLGVAGPIWRAYWTATPDQWLGFAGNILGGLATLAAAFIAWRAVQVQVREARRGAEQQRKDLASEKLNRYSSALFMAYSEQNQIALADPEQREEKYKDFEKFRVSPSVLELLGDPILGRDTAAIALFMNILRNDAGVILGKLDQEKAGHTKKAMERLHQRLHEMIDERRRIMTEGSIDDLASLKLIRLKPYHRLLKEGGFLFDDGTGD